MKNGLTVIFNFLSGIFCLFGFVNGQCTFPGPIRGNWITSDKGTLNFTADTILAYRMKVSASVDQLDFTCWINNGDMYLLRSPKFKVFGVNISAYLCIELHPISNYKYWYHVANKIESTVNEPVYFSMDNSEGISEACDRPQPYDISNFNTLIKEGGFEDGLVQATCPPNFLHKFSNGSITSADDTQSCDNITLDVCSDRTHMKFTYDSACDADLLIASDGLSVCLLDHTNDKTGVTYLHVWNNDTTLASGVARINCYAFEKVGDVVMATLYPGSCEEGQTAKEVSSPGVKVNYTSITTTCQDTVGAGSQILYIVAVTLGAIGLVIIVVILICVIKRTKCQCCICCKKSQLDQSKVSLDSSLAESQSISSSSHSNAENDSDNRNMSTVMIMNENEISLKKKKNKKKDKNSAEEMLTGTDRNKHTKGKQADETQLIDTNNTATGNQKAKGNITKNEQKQIVTETNHIDKQNQMNQEAKGNITKNEQKQNVTETNHIDKQNQLNGGVNYEQDIKDETKHTGVSLCPCFPKQDTSTDYSNTGDTPANDKKMHQETNNNEIEGNQSDSKKCDDARLHNANKVRIAKDLKNKKPKIKKVISTNETKRDESKHNDDANSNQKKATRNKTLEKSNKTELKRNKKSSSLKKQNKTIVEKQENPSIVGQTVVRTLNKTDTKDVNDKLKDKKGDVSSATQKDESDTIESNKESTQPDKKMKTVVKTDTEGMKPIENKKSKTKETKTKDKIKKDARSISSSTLIHVSPVFDSDSIITPSSISPDMFVARKPRKVNFPSVNPFELFNVPSKVEPLYEVEPRPMSNKVLFKFDQL